MLGPTAALARAVDHAQVRMHHLSHQSLQCVKLLNRRCLVNTLQHQQHLPDLGRWRAISLQCI